MARRRSSSARTGINRWERPRFANTYNPIALQSQQLAWTDLNRDDVAQGELGCTYLTAGCEINFGQLPTTFGAVVYFILNLSQFLVGFSRQSLSGFPYK